MEKVFAIDTVDFDPSVEQTGDLSRMTPEEYLSWVRHQAESLPDVFRAKIDPTKYRGNQTQYMPQIKDSISCTNEQLLPQDEWINKSIHSFSILRSVLERNSSQMIERSIKVPQLKNSSAWKEFCFGRSVHGNFEEGEEDGREEGNAETSKGQIAVRKRKRELSALLGLKPLDEVCSDEEQEANVTHVEQWTGPTKVPPTMRLLLQFDQVMTQRLFCYHVDWLENWKMSLERGSWLYGLLARLEKPLHQDIAAAVRQLFRRCCELRSELGELSPSPNLSRGSPEDEACEDVSMEGEQLAVLNAIIAITGAYFGQGEGYSAYHCESRNPRAVFEDDNENSSDDLAACSFDDEEDVDDGEVAEDVETTIPDGDRHTDEGVEPFPSPRRFSDVEEGEEVES